MYQDATPPNINARVATAVRVELARRNLRYAALAPILGVSTAAVSNRMTCAVPWSVEDIDAISRAWGIPMSVLLGESIAAGAA